MLFQVAAMRPPDANRVQMLCVHDSCRYVPYPLISAPSCQLPVGQSVIVKTTTRMKVCMNYERRWCYDAGVHGCVLISVQRSCKAGRLWHFTVQLLQLISIGQERAELTETTRDLKHEFKSKHRLAISLHAHVCARAIEGIMGLIGKPP